jgi:acetyltransferase-like isoleucine patch superfamily enzyme
MAFLKQEQLDAMGFQYLGKDVLISDKASIYNAGKICIGDHSRIDDFVILSPGSALEIGRYVHIGCYSSIIGHAPVRMEDYSGVSSKVSVFSSSDDYDGEYMTNPCIPKKYTRTKHFPVYIGKHVVIGAGSTILPGVHLENCAVGAMSLVTKSCKDLVILAGIPAKPVKERSDMVFVLGMILDQDLEK